MGYYVEGPSHGKVAFLVETFGAERLEKAPTSFDAVPSNKALVAVVDNGYFEAAAYVHNVWEFQEFTNPEDPRPRVYLLADKAAVERASGFSPR